MADRTIKPDSGNDLVLQNNGGGTKIEIPNSGNIAVTGTFENIVTVNSLSNRNVLINGAMQCWQRSSSSKLCYDGNNEGYSNVDRFSMQFGSGAGQSGNGRITTSQETSVLPDIAGGDKFNKALKLVCTATESPGSAKEIAISHRVEGQDMQRFGWGQTNPKSAILSFYFKTSLVGVYSISLTHTGTGPRRRMISFNVADTNWNRYQIPISADTVKVPDDNTLGLNIMWFLMNVPSYQYTGGTDSGWGTTIYLTDDDQVNFLSSTANSLYITGVQLELGSVATPFEHRSFGDELRKCQRYCVVYGDGTNGAAEWVVNGAAPNTTNIYANYLLPVPPRSTPTVSCSGLMRISDNYVLDHTANPAGIGTQPNTQSSYTNGGRLFLTGFSGLTIGRNYGSSRSSGTGKTTFDMEL